MIVARWGSSLVIRLPSSVVDALELKEGDEVSVRVSEDRAFEIERNEGRLQAIEKIKSFKIKLPVDWKFDRDEANSR